MQGHLSNSQQIRKGYLPPHGHDVENRAVPCGAGHYPIVLSIYHPSASGTNNLEIPLRKLLIRMFFPELIPKNHTAVM